MSIPNLGKILLVFVFTSCAFLSQAQLVANFTATPLSGCAPLLVSFSDLSTGSPTSWKWDLGNGTISFIRNPSVTYFTPGQYNVKLVVQNALGKDSITRVQYITVNAPPVVNFSASVFTGCYPLNVQFTDLSNPVNGTINSWLWDFGDGSSSTLQNPNHVYTSAGNYNVSLRVSNSLGCFTTLTRSQYIQINNGVIANFSNNSPNSCAAPVTINFTNLSSGSGTLTYNWNFGDGATSSLVNPTHTYLTSGSYTITLIVTNSTGCRDTIVKPNAITIGNVQANFSYPDTLCVNTLFRFINTSTPPALSATWYFGDGTQSTATNPLKQYAMPGTYTVKLVSNFGSCIDSVSKTITILAKPVAAFTASPLTACKAPLTVQFTSSSSNGISYSWQFGDGNNSTLNNPVHTYLTPGLYSVSLVVTNAAGCTDTITKQQYIKIVLPQVSINSLFQEGCAPLSWTFTSTLNSIEPATSYFWDFGDGSTSTSATPTHIFAAGVYDITLIITTASGCTDTVMVTSGIRAGNKPVVNFGADPRDACAKTIINFTDSSQGNITQWFWQFGDGGTSTQQNPAHVYSDTGYFTVTLIVWDNGCSDTLTFVDYVHINPPIAAFAPISTCSDAHTISFQDASIGADTWNWDFGDGNTSTLQNPVHVYNAQGIYTVTLTVFNIRTGCDFTTSQQVQILEAIADFSANDTVICRNTSVDFTAINTVGVASFNWDFGDGSTATGINVQHVYLNSGNYTVTLVIQNLIGCSDTLVKFQYIRVNGPVAAFSPGAIGSCLLSAVNFIDSSTTDGIHPINQWIWSYGDGQVDTLFSPPFQHLYANAGIYTVSLTVTDSEGCTDIISKNNLLTISRPLSIFNSVDTITCPGKNVRFVNNSSGPSLQYKWYFGDGFTSTVAQPVHVYAADGVYDIKLVVTDQFGCMDSLIKPAYIRIVTPVAAYTVSDSISSCPPLVVQFSNQSQNAVGTLWDFGDGSTSQIANPSHFYNIPGTYISKLTITSPGGCISVKQKTIIVRGPYGSFSYGALTGCKPLTVNFRATTTSRNSFVWDFNDGSTISTTDSIISHTYNLPGIYVPKMILLDAGGCMVPITGLDTIVVKGVTVNFSPSATLFCDRGDVQFTNTTVVTNDLITGYSWDFGDGTTSIQPNPFHSYNATGNYFPSLKVTTQSGCTDSLRLALPIKIIKKPDLQAFKTADGCIPLTVTFNSSLNNPDTSAMTYQWIFGNGQLSSQANPTPQVYPVAGNFPVQLIAINSSGCRDTSTLLVKAFAIPVIKASLDTFICKGNSVRLSVSGGSIYTWSPAQGLSCTNCSSPMANPDSLRKYIVIGTSSDGCINKDSVNIAIVYPFKMKISRPDSICIGGSAQLFATGANSYSWTPTAGITVTNISMITVTPQQTTTYKVIGKDGKNCFADTAYIPITVFPIPTVDGGPDKTINTGQSVNLVPIISADVTNVTWSPTGSITQTNYPAITVKPKETTQYLVQVTNAGGCQSRDIVTVFVICNGANVFIPNTFSPNGDGANDIFYPRGSGLFSIRSLKIFNRWGEIVYQKNDFMPNDERSGWNGMYKGQKLNPDVFIYTMEIMCDNSTVLTYKGNIALIK